MDLAERLAYWQKRLRLQDWKVEVEIVRQFDASHEHCQAYVDTYEQAKHARIKIIEPGDLAPDSWPRSSLEEMLVHELIHLHLWPFNPKPDTSKWTAMEQAVDAIAGALVEDAKR